MSDAPPALLVAKDLEKTYPDGDVRALQGVSLEIALTEFVAITGPSGCGKSTLLHALGGLDRPDRGDVTFRGQSLRTMNLDRFRAQQVGFVFQSFHLVQTLTAVENVQVPMFEQPWTRSERVSRAARLLDEVGISRRASHRPSRLSVGERQRVAIARALANDPCLILADEPTGNLDSRSQEEILSLLERLQTERGLTMVIVTHAKDVANRADREICLRDGRIV